MTVNMNTDLLCQAIEGLPTPEKVEEAIYHALGEASMCWSETPQGVFQDGQAIELANSLIRLIKQCAFRQVCEEKQGGCEVGQA